MARAPRFVGLLLGLCVALVVALAGPLLLFNPAFVVGLQDRHEVAERSFGGQEEAVQAATATIVADLWTDGDFVVGPAGVSLLDDRERSHMTDVSRLLRLLALLAVASVVGAALALLALRGERRRVGGIFLAAAGAVGVLALVIAIVFAVAFEPAFLAFHAVFFPPGTYLFVEGSNLIRLFPEAFWFDASLAAGGAILVTAAIAAVVGLALWRSGASPRAA